MGKGVVKLGEGQWATKDGKLLAAKETNGRFKNTEFTVSRGTDATYVNRNGLLVNETGDDTPRIDFTDNTDGHLLLEPQSTNLINYSEDFSEWTPTNATTTQNVVTSPDGTVNANKIIATSTTGQQRINFTSSNASGSTTFSFFAKAAEYNSCWARIGLDNAYFDLENGLSQAASGTTSSIEDFGNGWYRCIMTKASSSANEVCRINITTSYLDTDDFLGDDTSGIYLYGGQHEQLSHATSYIPTNGGQVTRDGETCTGAGEAADFNSEEGILYAEIAALANDGNARYLGLNDGSSNNRVVILYYVAANAIRAIVEASDVKVLDEYYIVTDVTDFHKVAVKYKANDFALWVDGEERETSSSGSAPIGLNKLDFTLSSNNFYGKCKAIRVYKEALSDTDLENLTS